MLTGAAPLRARRGAACLLACTAALGLAIAVAGPARADIVRDRQQWVLDALDVQAEWGVTQGQGVTVAVIDSGVNPAVSDLAGSVSTGPDFTGVSTPPSNPNWGMHGTWMASLIAGHGHDNGSGILGVAPQSRVLSIRVITDRTDPGYTQYEREPLSRGQRQLAKAIRYAVSHGAGVISMSLGYSTASRVVRSALQDALSHDVIVVASSGNSGDAAGADGKGHAPYSFPADYPGVLGVAAVDRAGAPAAFSSQNLSVQVAAPGVHVPAQGNDGQYWLVSGTSPACALTAGVAALIRSRYPGLPPALVRQAITSTTQDRPSGGYDEQVGFGTIDAAAALTAAGQLAGRTSHRHGVIAARQFGGGPRAVPPAPIGPRGATRLALLSLLGLACLALAVVAARQLLLARQHGPLTAAESGGGITAADGQTAWRDLAMDGQAERPAGGAEPGWPAEDGRWPAEDGRWPAEDGGWPAEDGGSPPGVGGWPADNDGSPAELSGSPAPDSGWPGEDSSWATTLQSFSQQPGSAGQHADAPDRQGAAEAGE